MDPDIMLLTGIGLAVLSVPSLLSAWADDRPPRVGAVVMIVGLALAGYAVSQKDGGYRVADVPDILYEALARMLN